MATTLFDNAQQYVENYPLEDRRWFRFMRCASQAELLHSQEGFFFAVKAFPRMLAKLASAIEDSESRLLVIENLWEEHGQGDVGRFHTNTYLQYLTSLGLQKESSGLARNPWVDEWIAVALAKDMSASRYAAYLAGIEYIYAPICQRVSEHLQRFQLVCPQTHYATHGVLDYDHAAELLRVAALCRDGETDEDLLACFQTGVAEFLAMFDKMTRLTEGEARSIAQESVAFYYGREDAKVEVEAVRRVAAVKAGSVKVLMVCSGGENAIALLKMDTPTQIVALDINPHQIALAREKIDAIRQHGHLPARLVRFGEGKFERLFAALARSFSPAELAQIGRAEQGALDKLRFVCDNLFSNRILEIVFTEEATKYSSANFAEHFYKVFSGQIAAWSVSPPAFSNIGSVLGRSAPIDYAGPVNRASTISYFHGSFEDYFAQHGEQFDVIDVSNITDWMSTERAAQTMALVASHLREGGVLIGRKLLGNYDWPRLLEEACGGTLTIEEVEDATGFYTQTVIAKTGCRS